MKSFKIMTIKTCKGIRADVDHITYLDNGTKILIELKDNKIRHKYKLIGDIYYEIKKE